jgi:putative ABC transport system permease protein
LVTPVILAEDIKRNFPEVKNFCRIQGYQEPVIVANNQEFSEDNNRVAFVDKNFFSFFGLPLINTNASNAFAGNKSAVISERTARKYFGNVDAVGKVINIRGDNEKLYTVSAVAKNFPSTSSMQFEVVFPVEAIGDYESKRSAGVNTSSILTLIELKGETNIAAFKKKLTAFGEEYFKPLAEISKKYDPNRAETKFNLSIRPFSDAHYNASSPWFYFTDLKSIYQLSLLALIALGIACLNYILLSLSRVAARSQEAGVRKTVGAGWNHIINMFLMETFAMVIISMITGYIIAVIALPYFNELTSINIPVIELLNWKFVAVGIGVAILLTLLAGIYPAIKMAGIKPLSVMSKFSTYKLNPSLSKIFITLQYTVCIVLIVYSLVIAQQIKFINNKNLGFEKEQTLLVRNPFWGNKEKTLALRDQLYQYTASQPDLNGATGSDFKFAAISRNGHNIDGKKEMIAQMNIDYDYFSLNKISLVKGRFFSKEFITDTTRLNISKEQIDTTASRTQAHLVVNETLYKMLGSPPLNEVNRPLGGIIVGVSSDYFFMGLQQKIEPAYHKCNPKALGYFWFKIGKNKDIATAANKIKSKFKELTNGEEFKYSFMDEDINVIYESHERWLRVINMASWMAVFIACLGLFGLSAIIAVNRTKEIGIRKILGARVVHVFYSLNRQTFFMVLLSIIIAIPIAVFISKSWLQNFAYRIDLKWGIFALAGIIGFACALIAVSYHSLRAANNNPVKSLRTE